MNLDEVVAMRLRDKQPIEITRVDKDDETGKIWSNKNMAYFEFTSPPAFPESGAKDPSVGFSRRLVNGYGGNTREGTLGGISVNRISNITCLSTLTDYISLEDLAKVELGKYQPLELKIEKEGWITSKLVYFKSFLKTDENVVLMYFDRLFNEDPDGIKETKDDERSMIRILKYDH